MSCPGLHCAGCGSKYSLPVIIPLAIVLWVLLQNLVLVLVVVIGALLVTSLVVGILIKRQDAREQAACDVIRARMMSASLRGSQRPSLPAVQQQAIGGTVIINVFGSEDQAAEVIRRAIQR